MSVFVLLMVLLMVKYLPNSLILSNFASNTIIGTKMSKIKTDKQTKQNGESVISNLEDFIRSKKKQNDGLKKVIQYLEKTTKDLKP